HTLLLHGMARLPWKCEVSAIFRAQSGFHFTDSALAPADVDARPILSYGPWYQGRYDGVSIGIRKRMTRHFTTEAFYTWTNAIDNALQSSFVSEVQTGLGAGVLGAKGPTDSFIGIPPPVTDPVTGQSNASGRFIAGTGNPVPQAGKFYNGADLDPGPSDLTLHHPRLLH